MSRRLIFEKVLVAGLVLWGLCVQGYGRALYPREIRGAVGVVLLKADGHIGRVYLAGQHHITCVDGRTGRAIWSVLTGSGKYPPTVANYPVVEGSTLVYATDHHGVYGLSVRTGKRKWVTQQGASFVTSGPDDMVYAPTVFGLGVIAMDVRTGVIEWEHRPCKNTCPDTLRHIRYFGGRLYTDSSYVWDVRDGRVISRWSGLIRRAIASGFTLRGGRLFLASRKTPLLAVDARTRRLLWTAPNPLLGSAEVGDLPSISLSASSRFVAAMFYSHGSPTHHILVRIYDAASGRLLWQKTVVSPSKHVPLLSKLAAVDNRFVYLVEHRRRDANWSKVMAFSGRTGKRLWTYDSHVWLGGGIVSAGNTILVPGSYHNHTITYALNRRTGTLRWRFCSRLTGRCRLGSHRGR